eukprot:3213935-Prymnesium_polylepis.1
MWGQLVAVQRLSGEMWGQQGGTGGVRHMCGVAGGHCGVCGIRYVRSGSRLESLWRLQSDGRCAVKAVQPIVERGLWPASFACVWLG